MDGGCLHSKPEMLAQPMHSSTYTLFTGFKSFIQFSLLFIQSSRFVQSFKSLNVGDLFIQTIPFVFILLRFYCSENIPEIVLPHAAVVGSLTRRKGSLKTASQGFLGKEAEIEEELGTSAQLAFIAVSGMKPRALCLLVLARHPP